MNTTTQLISMKDRCVLITGAAAGIGKAMALRIADAGADLVLVDIDKTGLEQTAEDLCGFSSKVETHVGLFRSESAILGENHAAQSGIRTMDVPGLYCKA